MIDPAAPEIRPRERVGDRALARDHADVARPINEDAVAGEKPVDLVELRDEIVQKFLQLRDECFRQIPNLTADARVGSGEARSGQEFEQIIEFLAFGEGVEKNRHRAEVERHRAEPEEVRGNARVSQQMTRIAWPRGGSSQPINFSTASA